jgi:Ca2+-binding RTX toxin-like protein
MSFTLVNTQTIIARNAGALYGLEVGNANMTSYVSQVGPNTDAFLNAVYVSSVGMATTASVAEVLVANLGITGDIAVANSLAGQAKAYIVGALNGVPVNARGAAINNILSLFSNLTADPVFGAAATAWNNKVANAVTYAATAGTLDTAFSNVSPTAPSQTFTLTTGVDIKSGGSGTDVFDGSVNANNTATLTSVDQLDGKDGTDTLIAGLNGGNIAPKLTSIEHVELIAQATATFDLVNATGVTDLLVRNSAATLTVNNIADSTATTFALQDQSADLTLQFANAALVGANSFTLSLSGAQKGAGSGPAIAVNQQAGTDTSGLESLTLASAGTNTNFLTSVTAPSLATLKVTGAQGLTIDSSNALATTVRTVDVSGMTGTVGLTASMAATATVTVTGSGGADNLKLSSSSANVTVQLGAGNDSLSLANFNTNDTVAGGDGTADRLDISASDAEAVSATLTNTTGFEQISLNASGTAGASVNATRFGAIDTVRLDKGTAGNYGVTMQAGTVTVGLAQSTSNEQLNGTLTVTDTGTATTDVLNINNRDTDATVGSTTDNFNTQAITSAGYETVNLSTGTTATKAQTVGIVTLNNDSLSAANTLNISGANGVTVTEVKSNSSGLLTINASGLTGTAALTMTNAPTYTVSNGTVSITGSASADTLKGTAATAATIDGGAGNDTIIGGSAADSITGGAGNDAITAGGGNDVVDAGDGNDSVTVAAGTVNVAGGAGNDAIDMGATLTVSDTVAGGDGTDTLSLAAVATAANSAGVSGFETLSVDAAYNQGMEQFTSNSGFTRINFNTGAGNVAITNASVAIDTIQLQATGSTFSLARLVDTSTNAMTILTEDVGGGVQTTAGLTLNDEETLTINTGTASDATASNGTGEALTITALNASDLTTLTVSGANAVVISGTIGGAANLATVNVSGLSAAFTADASTSTANLTFTGSFSGSNVFTGGTGADALTGGTAADTLVGGNGGDTISGGAGADSLSGGLGADVIMGEIGADTITGGVGSDTLTGGDGADVFVFEAASNGVDTITDFVAGIDKLNDSVARGTDMTINAAAVKGAMTDASVYYISMNGAAANLTTAGIATLSAADMTASSLTNLAAYLDERFTTVSGTDDSTLVINWTAGGSTTSYVYNYVAAGGNTTVEATELTLLGVVTHGTSVLAAGDVL